MIATQFGLENIASKKDILRTKLDNGISARILQPDSRPDPILNLHQENATAAVDLSHFVAI